jgi:hypothetical protein
MPYVTGPVSVDRYYDRVSRPTLGGGYSEGEAEPETLGFSLGKIVKNIGKTVKKAVVDTGHVAGKVVTSTAGQAVIGGALALTGVGLPAAAAIGAASKGVGNLIKPGGNLKGAATGAAQGAALGVGASLAGKVIKTVAPGVTNKADSVVNKLSGGRLFKRAAAPTLEHAIAAQPLVDAIANAPIPGVQAITGGVSPVSILPAAALPIAAAAPVVAPKDKSAAIAKRVLAAGKASDVQAGKIADSVDKMNAKIGKLQAGLRQAQGASDAVGASAITQQIAQLSTLVQQAQMGGATAAAAVRNAGAAIEGATVGAVGGSATNAAVQWVKENPMIAAGVGGAALLVLWPKGGGSARYSRGSDPGYAPAYAHNR